MPAPKTPRSAAVKLPLLRVTDSVRLRGPAVGDWRDHATPRHPFRHSGRLRIQASPIFLFRPRVDSARLPWPTAPRPGLGARRRRRPRPGSISAGRGRGRRPSFLIPCRGPPLGPRQIGPSVSPPQACCARAVDRPAMPPLPYWVARSRGREGGRLAVGKGGEQS